MGVPVMQSNSYYRGINKKTQKWEIDKHKAGEDRDVNTKVDDFEYEIFDNMLVRPEWY